MHVGFNKAMMKKRQSRRTLRVSGNVSAKIQFLLDVILVEVMLFISLYINHVPYVNIYHYPVVLTPLLMWFIYSNSGVYRRHSSRTHRVTNIFFAWVKVGVILIIMGFIFKVSEDYSRAVILSWWMLAVLLQIMAHLGANILAEKRQKNQVIPALLVGNSQLGSYLAEEINKNPWTAHEIIGVISDDRDDRESWTAKELPRLGGLNELYDMVVKHNIRRVYFALPLNLSHKVREMQLDLVDLNIDIIWAPDIFDFHMVSPSVKEVAGIPLYYLSENPMIEGAWVSKMILDKVVAVMALIFLSPIMLIAALAIKLSSLGPVFYRQERHGLDGEIFQVLKFRSMTVHEETDGQVSQATKGDIRVTKVGHFLRKSSIDELPQIFNVPKGEMSLVGPRPHARAHNDFYADKINAYMSRHRVLPGMTGLAQVNGCRGETDAIEKMEKRVEYDLAYINNWTIWLDIRIMLKTFYTLFSKNAY
ncbi:MAG: undecaprenyl-phosphate glucose phosphotransferase [Mariprofundaceae bacterium]|nr:undecaprenyl-phosphate glucose phosphotransferase [Mariprofundaceae bacterium]